MTVKIRRIFGKAHLWVGLLTAPVVFFICVTGTIIVFGDEIIEFSAGKARYVKEVKQDKVSIEIILKTLKQVYPDRLTPFYLVAYQDPNRSLRFNTFGKTIGLRMVYVDPYTGEVLKDDPTINFFFIVAHLHHSLLLGEAGEWVVKISTLLFVISLITGIVLWLPKNRDLRYSKTSFLIKWQAKFKNLNYDLHNVLGFYSLAVVLTLSLTGLILAFESWKNVTIDVFGGNSQLNWKKNTTEWDRSIQPYPLNNIIERNFNDHPEKSQIQIMTYLKDAGYYYLKASERVALKSTIGQTFLVFDKRDGKEVRMPETVYRNETIENTIWMLHMGTWYGTLGKNITLIGGVIATSLPVTGFVIWINKRKRMVTDQVNLSKCQDQ
jgi:uncharacterized iron-regulated membrane protein